MNVLRPSALGGRRRAPAAPALGPPAAALAAPAGLTSCPHITVPLGPGRPRRRLRAGAAASARRLPAVCPKIARTLTPHRHGHEPESLSVCMDV
jgi:hypothetical protein